MSFLIPKPIRDLWNGPSDIKKMNNPEVISSCVALSFQGVDYPPFIPAKQMMKTLIRIPIVAATAFALYQLKDNPQALVAGTIASGVFSFPATLLLVGGCLEVSGLTSLVNGIGIETLKSFGSSLGSIAFGMAMIECHDVVQVGILEKYVKEIAEKYKESFAQIFVDVTKKF